ncbi:MAG: phosphonate ABC transporter substrate-binding protein [Rhodospirillales bacterium]|nr:phosphonate ABC transporter substrate-binding protein [Rhodospirillales bacterium]
MFHKLITAAAVAAVAMTATAAQADFKALDGDPKEINFGIISTESTANLKEQWLPFLKDMETATGMTVKPFFAPDYAGIIEGMRFGKVHVAWYGNKSAMEAVDRAGAEVFVQTVRHDGTKGYYSHIITHKDNDKLNNLDDLLKCDKSLDFGIGDPNSTSGFLVPSYYVFALNNVDPKNCFKTVRNANHETNFMATANKQVDAAANNSEQIERSHAKVPDTAKNVKVVWTSPLIPSDPITFRKDLSQDMKANIKGFFLSYGRNGTPAENKKALAILNGMQMAPFVDSSNAQLYPIRQLALFKDKLKAENNAKMSAAEKTATVKGIDTQLATLEVLSANIGK